MTARIRAPPLGMLEIHRVTFDERLDRVQSNLHLVISELLSVSASCEAGGVPLHRMAARLDSAILLFVGELRTTRDSCLPFSQTWRRRWTFWRSF